VTVSNAGTRATTVRDVGFFIAKQQFDVYRSAEDTEPYTHGEGEIGCSVAQGVFLEAGESKEFEATEQVLGLGVHADQPLRLYARDIRGRRVWGQAVAVVRLLFGPEPALDQMPVESRKLFETPEAPLFPGKVEPRWKLWKKRELRRPTSWRNPAAPRR
jgi:hypothetical protein